MERFTRGMAVQLQAAARQEETELREQRWQGERRSRADRAHAAVREPEPRAPSPSLSLSPSPSPPLPDNWPEPELWL